MGRDNLFRVLIASDGSRVATAAVKTALRVPWPSPSQAYGVVANDAYIDYRRSIVLAALDDAPDLVAARATRLLATRWPAAQTLVVKRTPADAIVREALRVGADVIVMGWRGHGVVRRLLAGSVSRSVVRRAPCPVLVTRRAIADVKRIVVGVDGSSQSRAAVDFVARLPGRGRQVTLVTAVELMRLPSQVHLTSAMRATMATEIGRINRTRHARARKELERARASLVRRNWNAEIVVTAGAPLRELLRQVAKRRADLVVVGACGITGLDRVLLGSVANGALDRSPVPVLIVP
jgi:nucleotide-binding universal stress UspA family protein